MAFIDYMDFYVWCLKKSVKFSHSLTCWNDKKDKNKEGFHVYMSELILDLRQANERRRYKVTPSLIGWART